MDFKITRENLNLSIPIDTGIEIANIKAHTYVMTTNACKMSFVLYNDVIGLTTSFYMQNGIELRISLYQDYMEIKEFNFSNMLRGIAMLDISTVSYFKSVSGDISSYDKILEKSIDEFGVYMFRFIMLIQELIQLYQDTTFEYNKKMMIEKIGL